MVGGTALVAWTVAEHFMPTSSTGQMTAAEVFASMMHIYASGSTGFSFFIES
eukprot:m.131076 g.131076  ORF g.131076 m.131076 type:complete len:52 (-) comp15898_c0_seq1:115-270(-)